ncbi:aldehyde dehydrogenase family protein [Pseudorhodoplanes sp.]|uniref:aldehyde dehydrogenase family protein n=1 Tax=Pseudorhodoplanes sp. TaxID=1934341 RepID=UPI003D0F6E2F
MQETYNLTIGGKSVPTKEHFEVRNPSTGEVVGLAPKATSEQLDQAVDSAQTAFASWSKTSQDERKKLCHAVAQKLADHSEEIARLITLEQGKPLNGLGSRFEMGGAGAWAHYTADLDIPVKVIQDNNEGRIELHRRPIGVVGSITPWNWPVLIAIWHIIPAIRAGNTVVNKPSPYTPLSTLRMIELMNEVLPAGVVNGIAGEDTIGAAMSSHDGIGKIVFTGSASTGKKVMSSAANTLKRLTLELGGNDAGIVLPDVDPKQIAPGLFWGGFINNGQTCAALKRLYVHDDVYDEVCAALLDFAKTIPMGDGLKDDSQLGPVQNRMQYDKVARLVEAAKNAGGKVLMGGEPEKGSLFYPVTLIGGLDNGNPLVDEEQFGPALPIIRYSDVDDAIARANDNPNGLGGSVWSKNIEKAKEYGAQLQCGTVWINKHGAIQPNAPFGGVKGSGIGVEFGEEGLFENTNVQVMYS